VSTDQISPFQRDSLIDLENSPRYRRGMRGRPKSSTRAWVEECETFSVAELRT